MILFGLQSPPVLCKWFHWIDTEKPYWGCRDIEERHCRAWSKFFKEEHCERVIANDKAEREILKLRAEQS
jgi:hypothetical protein